MLDGTATLKLKPSVRNYNQTILDGRMGFREYCFTGSHTALHRLTLAYLCPNLLLQAGIIKGVLILPGRAAREEWE